MTLQEAITLIRNKNIISDSKSVWADLGCGSGLFTYALAHCLHRESTIYSIDKIISSFKIISFFTKVTIKPVEMDFEKENFPFKNLDGILMANSLHFVKDKKRFIENMKSSFNNHGCFLIVEYDTEVPSPWVPYPINFSSLKKLLNNAGYPSVTKINERPSAFNKGNLYSAMIRR